MPLTCGTLVFARSARQRYRFPGKLLAVIIHKHLTFRVNCNREAGGRAKKPGFVSPLFLHAVNLKEIREGQASFYQRQLLRFSHRLTQVVSVPLRLGDEASGCQEVARKLDGKLSSLAYPLPYLCPLPTPFLISVSLLPTPFCLSYCLAIASLFATVWVGRLIHGGSSLSIGSSQITGWRFALAKLSRKFRTLYRIPRLLVSQRRSR